MQISLAIYITYLTRIWGSSKQAGHISALSRLFTPIDAVARAPDFPDPGSAALPYLEDPI